MKHSGFYSGFFVGAVFGGLVAAEGLRWSDYMKCASLKKESELISEEIGSYYKKFFDERGFSIMYNELEKCVKKKSGVKNWKKR